MCFVVRIRPALASDAEPIAAVLRAAFTPYAALYTRAGLAATAVSPTEVQQRIREGPVWVAETNGKIVGTVSAALRIAAVYVRGMAVIPEAQRRGIGDRLLHHVEQFARENDAALLELTTTPFLLSARRLYERNGFRYAPGEKDLHGTPLLGMEKLLTPAAELTRGVVGQGEPAITGAAPLAEPAP